MSNLEIINPESEPLEIVEVTDSVNYEVGMERLFTTDGTQAPAFATVRKDTGKVLGVVGERYTPLQNAVLFEQVEQVFKNSGHRFENTGFKVIDGGRQVQGLYRFDDITLSFKGDTSALTIAVKNSFDGSWKVGLDVGFFRFICSNGVKIPLFKGSSFSLARKHTESLSLAFAGQSVQNAINSIGEARNIFTDWSRTALTQAEGHKVLNGLVTHKAIAERMADEVRTIWDKPTYREDEGRNLWSLYNATTEHLTHAVAPKRFNLSERVGQQVATTLRHAQRNGIETLFVDSLPEKHRRSN